MKAISEEAMERAAEAMFLEALEPLKTGSMPEAMVFEEFRQALPWCLLQAAINLHSQIFGAQHTAGWLNEAAALLAQEHPVETGQALN